MADDRAASAVTFWPLHAWVDDLRYQYERDCAGSFDVVDPAPIASSVVWNSSRNITGEVVIEAGGVLHITGVGTIVQFADSEYNHRATRIVVKPGGRLVVSDGAALRGIEEIGQGGHGSVKLRSAWDGIYVAPVSGSGQTPGRIEMSEASILHARIGIYSPDASALVLAEDVTFRNNRTDVILGSKVSLQRNNGSRFTRCAFINDEELRDATWELRTTQGALLSKYHFKSWLTAYPEVHAKLSHVRDVAFNSCRFEHLVNGFNRHNGEGINAFLSDFKVYGTTFDKLGSGIRSIGDYAASLFNRVHTTLQSQINGSTGAEREALKQEQRGALYEVLRKRIDENGPLSAYQYLSQKASEGGGVYPRDLAVSAMDAQLWPAAQQHIYALPASDPDSAFLQWLLPVRQSGRSLAQLTEPEIAAFKILRDTRPSNNCIHVALDNDLLDEVIFDTPFVPNPGPLPEGDKPKSFRLENGTGKTQTEPAAWSVFPNPAGDRINIACTDLPSGSPMHVLFFDIMGRPVKRQMLSAAALTEIATADLPQGMYALQVRCAGLTYSTRVLISRP